MNRFEFHKIYGIIGDPLGHSLSPLLHTTAFRELGMAAVLVPWPVLPDRLADFMTAFRLLGIQGACVTIPHKETVRPFLDGISDVARTLGAVNLLHRRDGQIWGDNTDAAGFRDSFREAWPRPGAEVLLLGAGGAARAVVYGLKSLGFDRITIAGPTRSRADTLARDFDLESVDWEQRHRPPAEIVINTTPLGMRGRLETETPYPVGWLAGRRGLAYDVIYTPQETRFLQEARQAGWQTRGGLGMFLGQADHQFRIWTGRHLPEAAKKQVARALNQSIRSGPIYLEKESKLK